MRARRKITSGSRDYEKSSAAKITSYPDPAAINKPTVTIGLAAFPCVYTSEASVAVPKQRAEQRETLEQSERSQAHWVGDNSDQAYKMDPALKHPAELVTCWVRSL